MAYALALWKWKEPTVHPLLCYWLLCEDLAVPGLVLFDVDAVAAELGEEPAGPQWIHVAGKDVRAVRSVAARHGLYVFDPQRCEVTEEEQARFRKEVLDRQAALDEPDVRRCAEAGDSGACVELGNRYSFGEGRAEDQAKALHWYRRAMELGSLDGTFNVAACYRKGEGTERDIERAIELYREVAAAEPFFAAYELGCIYQDGEGVPVDLDAAREHFRASAADGSKNAAARLRTLDPDGH